jgi:hypothetical protein
MRRLALAAALSLLATTAFAKVEPARAEAPPATSTFETPAEPGFEAAVDQVVEAVKQTGFKDVEILPMMVVSATDANGKRVMLLIDPRTMQAIEFTDGDQTASSRR